MRKGRKKIWNWTNHISGSVAQSAVDANKQTFGCRTLRMKFESCCESLEEKLDFDWKDYGKYASNLMIV